MNIESANSQQRTVQEEATTDLAIEDAQSNTDDEIADIDSETEEEVQDGEKDCITNECNGVCCSIERKEPNQPTSNNILAATKKNQGKQTRSVQSSWFQQYPWLTLCESRNILFCFYCSHAERKNMITFSTKADKTFSKVGFTNWKKAGERFKKHESSQAHQEACMKICRPGNIGAVLDAAHKEQQLTRQRMLLKQLSSLKYLVRQGLAIRGHNDSEGNLMQLLCVRSEDDPDLKAWLADAKYLSPLIVNEQIKLFGELILRGLISEIRETPWFAVEADEASDVSFNEQMCVVIRWVNADYEIHEEPIGLMQVPRTDSATLSLALKDVLIRCMLPLSQCRGQAYDGAANMSGHLHGVAATIKSEQPAALHVHCLAHCLNLCLQDAGRNCTLVRDTLLLVRELVQLIKFSPKRSHLFEAIKAQTSPDTSGLRPLCPTRWTVRTEAIGAILNNYSTLCIVLDEVNQTGRDEYAVKAGGFLAQLEKFGTFFGLKLCFLVFSATEQLSRALQGKDTTIQEAKKAAMLAESHLRQQRSSTSFDIFYEKVLAESEPLTSKPILPRKRKPPRQTSNEADCYHHGTPQSYYRQKIL